MEQPHRPFFVPRVLRQRTLQAAVALIALILLASATGCSAAATEEREVPTATARTVDPPASLVFPSVTGTNLQSEPVAVPDAFSGAPVLLLVGYAQDAQFDIDRWLLGLLQAGTPVRCLEIPAIPGWIPSLLSGRIDDGMRSGIPSEDWRSVVTVYGSEAKRVAEFTGRERPLNARLLLLDADGRVAWFHDRGYSASLLLELDGLVRALDASSEPAADQDRMSSRLVPPAGIPTRNLLTPRRAPDHDRIPAIRR